MAGFSHGSVLISEFMADNSSLIMTDGDGNASDWIELHNTETQTIDLTGWYLTDDPNNLTLWQFPELSIPGKGFLIIFASGKLADDYVDALGHLHTNFRLSRNDEDQHDSLMLVAPDGTTVAHGYTDYPQQYEGVSFGLPSDTAATPLVVEATPVKALIPTETVSSWMAADFDDTSWPLTGLTGLGYENTCGYENLIQLDAGAMHDQSGSIYLRIPFNVADPGLYDVLTLRMKYDDGFVAYLNGEQVAQANAPESPQWDSEALAVHEADVRDWENFDISTFLSALQAGRNVLSIHGLNTPRDSSDMLILPELTASTVGDLQTDAPAFMTAPSPGSGNAAGAPGVVSDTNFSVDRGFYADPLEVAITTNTEDAQIYYTLNGSLPTQQTGALYTGPLTISETTILRAAAYKTGYASSNVDTQTYLFLSDIIGQTSDIPGPCWPASPVNDQVLDYGMDPKVTQDDPRYAGLIQEALLSIASISLVTDQNNLFDPSTGIYVNAIQDGREWERPTSVELIHPDGGEGFQIDAGLRIRGGMSRQGFCPKHSFRLFFRAEYGDPKLNYPLFGNEGVDAFDKLDLRTGQNFSWHLAGNEQYSTWLYDVFTRDAHGEMGLPYTRSRFYHLYINGRYWGLYQSEERPEARFAASYFGGSSDDYDVLKPADGNANIEATDGNTDAYFELWSEIASGMEDNADYFRIQGMNIDGTRNPDYTRLLDVDNLIDYMLLIFYTGNRDSPIGPPGSDREPRNLYTIYNRVNPDGFKFIAHDGEYSLGAHHVAGVDFNRVNVNIGRELSQKKYCTPWWIHLKLMEDNGEYRLRFADHVQKHFFNDGALTAMASAARFRARAGEIETAVIGESARWGDYLTPDSPRTRDDDWLPAVSNILDNYLQGSPRNRTQTVLEQIKDRGWFPDVGAPAFNHHGGSFDESTELFITAPGPVYYTVDGSDPRQPVTGDPAGILYTAPFPLTETTQVKARTLMNGEWSPVTEAFFHFFKPLDMLQITEIMYHPRPDGVIDGDAFEFIELKNAGTEVLDLSGVFFSDALSYTFPQGTRLGPDAFVVVALNPSAFRDRYPDAPSPLGPYTGNLANDGETIALSDANGMVITAITYDDSHLWPTEADGLGYSLVPVGISGTGGAGWPEYWRISDAIDGSPGRDDIPSTGGWQRPGDFNQDDTVNIGDVISLLQYLFDGGTMEPPCEGGASTGTGNFLLLDNNGDARLNLLDAIYLLSHLFQNQSPPVLGHDCVRMEGCPDTCRY